MRFGVRLQTPISTDRCANTERAWTAVNWIDARAPRPPYTKADTLISRPLSQPCVCSPSTPHFPNATHPHTSSHTSPHRTPLPSKHHWPPRATLETVGERVSAGDERKRRARTRVARVERRAGHHAGRAHAGALPLALRTGRHQSVRYRTTRVCTPTARVAVGFFLPAYRILSRSSQLSLFSLNV